MDNTTSKIIGNRLNTLLANKDIKQKELAQYLEVTDNTISYFVKGKRTPNTEQIIKISKYFDVSADYLLGLSETPTNNKDEQFICDYTGLNLDSIRNLVHHKNNNPQNLEFENYLISDDVLGDLSFLLHSYVASKNSFDFFVRAIHKEENEKSSIEKIETELFDRTMLELFKAQETLRTAFEWYYENKDYDFRNYYDGKYKEELEGLTNGNNTEEE